MREHGPWRIRDTRQVYRDPWVGLTVDNVLRPDGTPGTFSVVHVKPGISVVAMDDMGAVSVSSVGARLRYSVESELEAPMAAGADVGRPAPPLNVMQLERYLQLPPLAPAIPALAARALSRAASQRWRAGSGGGP